MDIRIKSYSNLSEALSDQALLVSHKIQAQLENTKDIHPTLIGEVFLSVKRDDAVEAIRILNDALFED